MKVFFTPLVVSVLLSPLLLQAATFSEMDEQLAKALAKQAKLKELNQKQIEENKACKNGDSSACVDLIETKREYNKVRDSQKIACNGPDCGNLPTTIGPDGNPIIDPNIIVLNVDNAIDIQNKLRIIEGIDVDKLKLYMKNDDVLKEFKSLGILTGESLDL